MSEDGRPKRSILKNLWDEQEAAKLEGNPLELLRYRSNLLGADLRITNFGGGNTSSKFDMTDPLTGRAAARDGGEGQRRRSRGRSATSGFAILYLDKLEQPDRALSRRSARRRDGRACTRSARSARTASPPRSTRRSTPSCRFRTSITCIPDWAIALAASANGKQKMRGVQPHVRPQDHLGAVAAARLRARADARSARSKRRPGCDGVDPRRPRALHVGRDAARVLPEQHPHHRPDGRVHPGARRSRRQAAVRRCRA